MLWHLQIEPATGLADLEGQRIAAEAVDLGLPGPWRIASSRGFLVEGPLSMDDLRRAAVAVLVDPVVETFTVEASNHAAGGSGTVVHVLPRPGVTDPQGQSALEILHDLGFAAEGGAHDPDLSRRGPC
jgi:phosphoribosylformylglycinamidine synthase subunit PurSL